MIQIEKTIDEKKIFDGKIIKVEVLDIEFEDGSKSKREIVRHNGGVAILARDEENKIFFIKQFRKALEMPVIELPAGKVEVGEDPDITAIRELEEEIGYTSDGLIKLGSVVSSPGFLTERIHLYKAKKLIPKKRDMDWDEHLEILRFTDDEVKEMVKKGEIYDSKTLSALYLEGLI